MAYTTILRSSLKHDESGATFISRNCRARYHAGDFLTVPLRLALSLSFLFPVCDRLGFLGPPGTPGVTWGNFANFLAYTAQVNSFAPHVVVPFLGVAATILETLFGITLLAGAGTRLTAVGSGALLCVFGTAMAISFGVKSPFDYSVFSAMGGSLLLAAWDKYPLSVDSMFARIMASPIHKRKHAAGERVESKCRAIAEDQSLGGSR
jgi:putative oxidoreductase